MLAFVIGTVECFFGFRLFKPTLFLVGFIAGMVLVASAPGLVALGGFLLVGIGAANLVPIHPGLAKYMREKGVWESKWDARVAKQ